MEELEPTRGRAEARTRRVSDVFMFAVWWFDQPPTSEDIDAKAPKFRTLMAKAKQLKNGGYDLELVKRTILTMRANGMEVTTPHAVKWRSPDSGKDWYAYSSPAVFPVWDTFANRLSRDNAVPLRLR